MYFGQVQLMSQGALEILWFTRQIDRISFLENVIDHIGGDRHSSRGDSVDGCLQSREVLEHTGVREVLREIKLDQVNNSENVAEQHVVPLLK